MPRKLSRIYTRTYPGGVRFWADFRSLGGGREALVPPGEAQATTDPDVAQHLAAERVRELEHQRRTKALLGIERDASLAPFASHHLIEKKRSGVVTDNWVGESEMQLQRAVDYFGADRSLSAIGTADVQKWIAHLQAQPNGRSGTLSGGTIRHHLNTISNLYRRAQSEGVVPPGYNPVASLLEKPSANRTEAEWFEVDEAALLLEVARTLKRPRDYQAMPFAYPLVATLLLTGGRRTEVLGLEVEDVSFDRKTVTFRPNGWRRLKTATSHRSVPLFPQLEEILRPYVFGAEAPPGRLLFPSLATGREAILVDPRKLLDAIAVRGGWKAGEIRAKALRHTYCSARLQTLDRGAPISPYSVAKELGHGGEAMVRRVYGHLGQVRHRADVVEYRIEQHAERLAARMKRLL